MVKQDIKKKTYNYKEDLSQIFENLFGLDYNGFIIRKSRSSLDIQKCNGVAQKDETVNACELFVALKYGVL